MKESAPKVCIILLNWNQETDTSECVRSLLRVDYPNYKILVVDNGSVDNSPENLRKAFPHVEMLSNPRNYGFTEGNNIGIRHALLENCDFIMLLNNDTIVEPDFLSIMVNETVKFNTIGIASPKIMNYMEPKKIWFAGGSFIPIIRKPCHLRYNAIDDNQMSSVSDIEWASGCCMLMSRNMIQAIGLLDKDYFNNYEDVDYCVRAKKKGYRIIIAPEAKIYHKFAASMGGKASPFYTYFRTRNNLLFFKKTKQWLPLIINAAIFPIYSLYESLKNKQFGSIYATFLGIWDFLIEKYGYGSAGKFSK